MVFPLPIITRIVGSGTWGKMQKGNEASLDKVVGATTIHKYNHLMMGNVAVNAKCLRCRHFRQGVEANLGGREWDGGSNVINEG